MGPRYRRLLERGLQGFGVLEYWWRVGGLRSLHFGVETLPGDQARESKVHGGTQGHRGGQAVDSQQEGEGGGRHCVPSRLNAGVPTAVLPVSRTAYFAIGGWTDGS